MVTLILVRHGYSEGNKAGIFTGQKDVALTPEGEVQARSVSKYIYENYKVDAIYSSDLKRARDTVAPLAHMLSLPVICRWGLREIDVGVWEGIPVSEVIKNYPERYELYKRDRGDFVFDGGESALDVAHRAIAVLDEIERDNEGKTVVIGTHGGVVRRLCAYWRGLLPHGLGGVLDPANASITVIRYDRGTADIQLFGYNEYLDVKITEAPLRR